MRSTAALSAARAVEDRPSLIVAHTHIGAGSPAKQDTFQAHGEPLGADEVRATKRALGWPETRQLLRARRGARSLSRVRHARRRARGRLAGAGDGPRRGVSGSRAGVRAGAVGIVAGRLGRVVAGVHAERRGRGHTRRRWQGAQRHRRRGDQPRRRVRRSQSVDEDRDEGPRRLRAAGGRAGGGRPEDAGHQWRPTRLQRTQSPLRRARARDGRRAHGHGGSRRRRALRRDVPDVLRLHAPEHPARGAEPGARHLRVHPRQPGARRRRSDAPADRAAGQPPGDSAHDRHQAKRRDRDDRGLARGAAAHAGRSR